MGASPDSFRADSEKKRFRTVGAADNQIGVATQIHGETSANVVLPIKVVDDGSGLGKLVTSLE